MTEISDAVKRFKMASPEVAIERLLSFMEELQVVPIIGPSLSVIEIGGDRLTVQEFLARELAKKHKVPPPALPPGYSLNDVVCAVPDFADDLSIICSDLRGIMENAQLPIPEPLRKLAQIPTFRLFVTTSFDGLLGRALEEEKHWRGEIQTLTYSLNSKADLDDTQAADERSTVLFELFGHLTSMEDQFTLTEDDLLEFAHNLQSKAPDCPENLLERTRRAHLLFIGNGFPDWLARFFLRTIKHQRNRSTDRPFREYIVDAQVRNDEPLMEFIKYFSRRTTIVDTVDATGFVDALHAAWLKEHPEPPARMPEDSGESRGSTRDHQKAVIFLSYAREDREAVLKIKNALEKIDWTIWMDTDETLGLEHGDEWRQKIQREIKRCDIFMPILSKNTDATRPGEKSGFRHEWKWALEESGGNFGTGWQFITPVRIDDLSVSASQVPDEFRKLNWGLPALGGELTDGFLNTMKRRVRELRSGRFDSAARR